MAKIVVLHKYSIPGSPMPLYVDPKSGWVNLECPDTQAKLWSRKCPPQWLHTAGLDAWMARQPAIAGATFAGVERRMARKFGGRWMTVEDFEKEQGRKVKNVR